MPGQSLNTASSVWNHGDRAMQRTMSGLQVGLHPVPGDSLGVCSRRVCQIPSFSSVLALVVDPQVAGLCVGGGEPLAGTGVAPLVVLDKHQSTELFNIPKALGGCPLSGSFFSSVNGLHPQLTVP